MRHHFAVRSRVCVASALVALLGACGRSRDKPADTTSISASASSNPSAGTPAAARGASSLPGQLTKPIDQYTGDELYAATHSLSYGGGTDNDRACTGNASCSGLRPKKTSVRVDAVDGQESLDPVALSGHGVIVVRARNNGPDEEKRYRMKASRTLEYYLIALPSSGTEGRWRLEELDTAPGARRHGEIASGALHGCGHTTVPKPPLVRASFHTCENSPHAADSTQRSRLRLQTSGTDPIWFACDAGCCIDAE